MTDFENSVWSVESSNQIGSRFGGPVNAELFAACRSNKTDVFVNRQQYVTAGGVDDAQPVTYRLDTERPETEDWLMSTDFTATSSPSAIALLKQMAGQTRLLAEATPYGESHRSAEYEVTGIDAVVADVRKRCRS